MVEYLNKISLKIFLLGLFLLPFVSASAQCPMCKMSAQDSDVRAGLNTGILYLLFAPVVLLGIVFGYWFYNRKKFGSQG